MNDNTHVQSENWKNYLPLILAVTVGSFLSLVAFSIVRNLEQQNIAVELESAANERVSALNRNLDHNLQELDSIAAFYAASNEVTRDEFQQFVQPFLVNNLSVQALEWVPRVPSTERKAFEAAAQKDGFADFEFTERNLSGELETALSRMAYFPVYFVEPYEGNEAAIGFDLASNATRLEALNLAQDTGQTVASAPINLVQGDGQQFGLLMFKPIYQNGAPVETLEQRQQNLQGFALGVFRVADILEDALSYLEEEKIDIYIFDQSDSENPRIVHYHQGNKDQTAKKIDEIDQAALQAGWHHATTLEVAGRKWLVLSVPTPTYITNARTWQPWVILFVGLLFTGFLGTYFLNNMRRTAELETTNERLAQEVNERHLAQEALLRTQEQLAKNNRVLEQRSKQLAKANQDVTDLSKRLKVEAIRLGAELERQQTSQRDVASPVEVTQSAPLTKPEAVIDQNEPANETKVTIEPSTDERELSIDDVTRQLQQMLLPTAMEVRKIKSLDIASRASNQSGGDEVDLLLQHGPIQVGIGCNETLMFMTGDVVRSLLTGDEKEHTRFVGQLNSAISDQAQSSQNKRSLALLDYALSGNLSINEKQKEMIVVFPDGNTSVVDGYTLGFDRTNLDSDQPVQLQPIDGVILYENQQEDDALEALRDVITRHWQEDASSIVDALIKEIEEQTGIEQDVTLLVVKQK